MGLCPDWYLTIRGARYLGVPPWEMERDLVWMRRALIAEAAEAEAADPANSRGQAV